MSATPPNYALFGGRLSNATETRSGARWDILDSTQARTKLIRTELKDAHGLYIFYNSQCRAIYIGKANRMSLWSELKSAFNRRRKTQSVRRTKHPLRGETFVPAYKKHRRIRSREVYLHEVAHYVSAYEVGDSLINNLEALLMRALIQISMLSPGLRVRFCRGENTGWDV